MVSTSWGRASLSIYFLTAAREEARAAKRVFKKSGLIFLFLFFLGGGRLVAASSVVGELAFKDNKQWLLRRLLILFFERASKCIKGVGRGGGVTGQSEIRGF